MAFNRKNWNEKIDDVVKYFNQKLASRAHTVYTSQYIGCKVLSIICIVSTYIVNFAHEIFKMISNIPIFFITQIINMIMLNMVIPGFWSTYSQAVTGLVSGDTYQWNVQSDLAFPRITKCAFQATGPSGSLQEYDALCLMPLNVVNQKVFVIIWVWYILQLIVSIGNLIFWAIVYYSKNLRIEILRRRSMYTMSRKQIAKATDQGHLGSFFILNQIAKNTNSVTFVELLNELSINKIDENNRNLNGEKSI